MVHNGIEYGVMAAYAEGLNILQHANVGRGAMPRSDAETAPLANPEDYRYDFDLAGRSPRSGGAARSSPRGCSTSPRRRSSSRRSSRTSRDASPTRARAAGRCRPPSTTGVPAPVLTTALYERFASRGEADYADRLLSAMRKQFGGHHENAPA